MTAISIRPLLSAAAAFGLLLLAAGCARSPEAAAVQAYDMPPVPETAAARAFVRLPRARPRVQVSDDSYSGAHPGSWGIQVGAVPQAALAKSMADQAAGIVLAVAPGSRGSVGSVTANGVLLHRARVVGMAKDNASTACRILTMRGMECFVYGTAP